MPILYFAAFLFNLLNREKLFYKYDDSGLYIFHLRAVRHSDNDISVSKYYFDQYYERIYSFGIVDCSLYSLSFACIWSPLKTPTPPQKPQYIQNPLPFLYNIWYNTHIAEDPKTGAFHQKTANLRGAEVCTSKKTAGK